MNAAPWPPAHIEALTRLWADGLSASQIVKLLARDFPGARYSRSGVIGKVHRLKLPKRSQDARSEAARINRAADARKPRPAPKPPRDQRRAPNNPLGRNARKIFAGGGAIIDAGVARPSPLAPVPANAWAPLTGVDPVAFMDRAGNRCRWPVDGPEHLCCGARTPEAQPYCLHHAEAARDKSPRNTSAKAFLKSLRRFAA